MKMNCWEFKGCERQAGGANINEKGVCPAATNTTHDGRNEGKNAGRYCWKVAGTLCKGKTEGTFAAMIRDCSRCDFYICVREEEGNKFFL